MLTFSSINTTHQTNLQFTDKQRLTRAAARSYVVFFQRVLVQTSFRTYLLALGQDQKRGLSAAHLLQLPV